MKSETKFPFTEYGDRLKALRLKKDHGEKLTQAAAAAAFGVNERTYKNWEYGATLPDGIALLKIADFYGVSVDYLLCRTASAALHGDDIARITGLSPAAVDYLAGDAKTIAENYNAWDGGTYRELRDFAREFVGPSAPLVLSDLIENAPEQFGNLIHDMHLYIWHEIENKESSGDDSRIYENERAKAAAQYTASVSLSNLLTAAGEAIASGTPKR